MTTQFQVQMDAPAILQHEARKKFEEEQEQVEQQDDKMKDKEKDKEKDKQEKDKQEKDKQEKDKLEKDKLEKDKDKQDEDKSIADKDKDKNKLTKDKAKEKEEQTKKEQQQQQQPQQPQKQQPQKQQLQKPKKKDQDKLDKLEKEQPELLTQVKDRDRDQDQDQDQDRDQNRNRDRDWDRDRNQEQDKNFGQAREKKKGKAAATTDTSAFAASIPAETETETKTKTKTKTIESLTEDKGIEDINDQMGAIETDDKYKKQWDDTIVESLDFSTMMNLIMSMFYLFKRQVLWKPLGFVSRTFLFKRLFPQGFYYDQYLKPVIRMFEFRYRWKLFFIDRILYGMRDFAKTMIRDYVIPPLKEHMRKLQQIDGVLSFFRYIADITMDMIMFALFFPVVWLASMLYVSVWMYRQYLKYKKSFFRMIF